jgi:branched-chain amino acid transport system permease protein
MVAVLTSFLIGIMYSRIGRSVEAVRTDELAARAMGINVHAVKLASVLMSAGIAGIAGVASAHSMGTIAPSEFSFAGSVTVLGFVILGGVASPLGALLGVVILTLLPQLLSGFSESRAMINGLAIVFVVMLFPSGLFPFKVIRIRGSAQRQ